MTLCGAGATLAPLSFGGDMTQIDWTRLKDAERVEGFKAVMMINLDGEEVQAPFNGGWLNFADSTHTEGSPQAVSADTSTLLTIDGLGGGSVQQFRRGIGADVWSGNTLRPAAVRESYIIRVTMKVAKATSNATTLELDLGIGTDWGVIIADERKPLTKGQGITDNLSFTFPIYCLDTFAQQGGRFYLLASENVTVWAKSIFIQRLFTP